MLIQCPECGKRISNLAETCINCGWPTKLYKEQESKVLQTTVSRSANTHETLPQGRVVTLEKICLKIDAVNAYAMIRGFTFHGIQWHSSIWVELKNRKFPALLTQNRLPTRFTVSKTGSEMRSDYYRMPYKYVALLENEYYIVNDIRLWKELCSNGLFNIWVPEAPYTRLNSCKTPSERHRIMLLRVYEIDREFDRGDVVPANSRIDHLNTDDYRVKLVRPVMSDSDFSRVKELLGQSTQPYLTKDNW